MGAMEIVGSTKFNDEVSWAFRIFDIDNSGSIAVEEINDSVQAVWVILDGVGDAIDGTVEEISAFLFERLNKQAEGGEVDEADFINFCAQDPPLGDCVVRIFRAMIHTWNFLFERWSTGPFWDALSDTSFQSAAFHSPAVEESDSEDDNDGFI